MRISELRAREDYDSNLITTLNECCRADEILGGYPAQIKTHWYCHPFFNVYTTRDFCADGRWYLRNQYLYTPHKRRRLLQQIAVEGMACKRGFEALLEYAFSLDSPEDSTHLMWLPGNHRFRRFDFERRIVRIYPKSGFSREGILKEIDLRTQLSGFSWVVPVLKYDIEQAVMEEPLLAAHPLNREPSPCRVHRCLDLAIQALKELQQEQYLELSSQEYLERKRKEFESAKKQLKSRFGGVSFELMDAVFDRAFAIIKELETVETCLSHGDFQSGNLLIPDENRDDLWLIDWEDAGVRAIVYDEMTYRLNSRHPAGLGERVKSFLESDSELWSGKKYSLKAAVALWVMEEWIWQMQSSSREGIVRLPAGISQFFLETGNILCLMSQASCL